MPKKRRFEYTEGSSNKFYEVLEIYKPGNYKVRTFWGRIGTLGQMQDIPCHSSSMVRRIASEKASAKKRKGYYEVSVEQEKEEDEEVTLAELKEESGAITLPRVWKELREQLLPGERALYEKYDDTRTSQRRKTIASKYKALDLPNCKDEEIKEVRNAAWLFLRFTYLQYLVSICTYKPAAHEMARGAVSQLKKKLMELPDRQKKAIDDSLKEFTNKAGKLSLAECNKGVEAFTDKMITEIKEKQKVGLGGVSRTRVRILARKRREKNEKKNGISK